MLVLPEGVKRAMDDADTFVMEVVPEPAAMQAAMSAMNAAPDGPTLAGSLPPALFDATVRALAARGLPRADVNALKPWAAAMLLSVPPAETGQFLDLVLYARALGAGKRVLGLETMAEQLAVFEGLSPADQVALLRETVAALPRLPRMYQDLLAAYLAEDLDALERLADEQLSWGEAGLAARFRSGLIDERNHTMTERLLPMLEHGDHFIAVGALHLPGATGLLAQLRTAGCEVTPVP